MDHQIKVMPEDFVIAESQNKLIRCNDRPINPGDVLELIEYNVEISRPTGNAIKKVVVSIDGADGLVIDDVTIYLED